MALEADHVAKGEHPYDLRLADAVRDYIRRRGLEWDEAIFNRLIDVRDLGFHDLRAALRAAGVQDY